MPSVIQSFVFTVTLAGVVLLSKSIGVSIEWCDWMVDFVCITHLSNNLNSSGLGNNACFISSSI